MVAKLEEIQLAFTRMQDEHDAYITGCRNAVQSLREDFAAYLNVPPSNVFFVDSVTLEQSAAYGTIDVPKPHNDAYDAGDFDEGGWYRIGLSFGLSASGETIPCWYPIMSLRLKRNSNGFVAQLGDSEDEFDLDPLVPSTIRPLSEEIANRMIDSAKQSSNNLLSGRRTKECGFHVR